MGVYIKGMEMPKNDSMIVAIRPDGMVENVMGCYVGKAIFVPPHGRLVEADRLAIEMMDAQNTDQALAMIDEAPTIIEAEEGET